jgi:hypothetical protein
VRERHNTPAPGNGKAPCLTVAALAEAKRLPVEFLSDEVGLRELPSGVGIPYHDATGEEIAVKQRTALKATEGSYWPKGKPLAAYGSWRIDAAIRAGFVILVEGESDCWALWHHGLPALGIPGANAVKTLEKEHVEGIATVYVHREPDNGGTIFVEGVRRRLAELGFAGKAFELRMPEEVKDPADLHARDPEGFKTRLEIAIQASTPIALSRAVEGNGRTHPDEDAPAGLATTCLATIRPEPVRWLVPGFLPLGKLVLVAGDGGHGKSALTLDLAACLTTGRPCFGLDYQAPDPADVLLVSCEDDCADTVVPRLLSAGADLARVWKVDGIKTRNGKAAPFSLAHFEAVETELAERPAVRLVVIDPAGAYVGRSGVDDYNDSELRSLLAPLAELAARKRATVLLVKHLVKGATAKAVHKVGGSAGYVNTVRAAFVVAPDADDPDQKLFLPLKFNLGPRPNGLAYRLRGLDPAAQQDVLDRYAGHLDGEDRERLAAQLFRVEWLGPVDADADTALGEAARQGRAGVKDAERAAEWLEHFLASRPAESARCVEEGNAALALAKDLKWWRESVLKGRLKGKPRKRGFGEGQRWYFTLPHHPWPFLGPEEGEEGEEANGRFQGRAWGSSTLTTSGNTGPEEADGQVAIPLPASSPSSPSSVAEPPPGARLHFADKEGRACKPSQAHTWTWEGGPAWYRVEDRPPPGW